MAALAPFTLLFHYGSGSSARRLPILLSSPPMLISSPPGRQICSAPSSLPRNDQVRQRNCLASASRSSSSPSVDIQTRTRTPSRNGTTRIPHMYSHLHRSRGCKSSLYPPRHFRAPPSMAATTKWTRARIQPREPRTGRITLIQRAKTSLPRTRHP